MESETVESQLCRVQIRRHLQIKLEEAEENLQRAKRCYPEGPVLLYHRRRVREMARKLAQLDQRELL